MRKTRAKSRSDLQNYVWAIAVSVLLVAGAVGVFMMKADDTKAELDSVSLCPKSGAKGHVVLLVDKTDMLGFVQNRAFLQLVSEFADGRRVSEGELLSIFILGADFTATPEPIFQRCNPGSGSGKSELTTSVDRLNKRFDEKFRKPIEDGVAKELVATGSSPKSPIFEMLQIVSLSLAKQKKREDGIEMPKKLVVVSDMLHNTESFSFFGRNPPNLKQLSATPAFEKLRADFSGVEVELQYLIYRPDLQTRELQRFWKDYFYAMRARSTKENVIPG